MLLVACTASPQKGSCRRAICCHSSAFALLWYYVIYTHLWQYERAVHVTRRLVYKHVLNTTVVAVYAAKSCLVSREGCNDHDSDCSSFCAGLKHRKQSQTFSVVRQPLTINMQPMQQWVMIMISADSMRVRACDSKNRTQNRLDIDCMGADQQMLWCF